MKDPVEPTDQRSSTNNTPASPRRPIAGLLAAGADAWNLSPKTTLAIVVIPFFVAASGVVAALLGKDAYKWLAEEDQFAETMQLVFYTAAWIMCLILVRHHFKAGNRLTAALYVVLCLGLFFLIGEESSWGQRAFGWRTPESLAAINKQEETNLHNIHGVGYTFKWVQLLVGAYGTLLPLVFLRPGLMGRHRELAAAIVPHYTIVLYFLPMFLWRLYRNLGATPAEYYYVITNYNEIIELILSMGFFMFAVFQLRRCLSSVQEMCVRTAPMTPA